MAAQPPVVSNWSMHQTEDGNTYYYDSVTQTSTWIQPPGFDPSSQVTIAAAAAVATGPIAYTGATGFAEATNTASAAVASGDSKKDASNKRKHVSMRATYDPQLAAEQEAVQTEGEKGDTKKQKKEEDLVTPDGYFKVADDKNPNVYVNGLPKDITEEEFITFMSKCGIIADDDDGKKKIKLYKDAEGNLKGDGLCTYFKVESVPLCIQLLDQAAIRDDFVVSISRAKFQRKKNYNPANKPKPKKKKKKKDAAKLLTWHEKSATNAQSRKVQSVLILKKMFKPQEFDEDASLIIDIKDDVRKEASKYGEVKKVLIFDRHPDGVMSIRFDSKEAADAALLAFNGRFFGGEKVIAEHWDGVTQYEIEETEAQQNERLAKWEKYIEDDDDKES